MYDIPVKQCRHEEFIKRSQFITTIAHIANADEANDFVATIKREFPDANHNCWAYVAGAAGDTAKVGMSDDGEPHGTAGKPMLNVLLHSEVGEIVAVVTRYFGGTKLGPGGLVKAYSNGVKNALEGLELTQKRNLTQLSITFDYAFTNQIKLLIESFEASILTEQFEANVMMKIEVPVENQKALLQSITDVSAGSALIKVNE